MKKISLLAAAVLLLSSLLFCFTACSSDDGDSAEDSTAEYSYVDSATPAKTSSEDVLLYFNELVNKIKSEKPAVSYNIEKSVPNDSIRVTKKGAEQSEETDPSLAAVNDSAKGLKDLMLENIKRTRGNIAYGEENSDILFVKGESWASKLTENDIKYASMKEVGDNYYITIAFNDLTSDEAQEILTKAFDLRDKDDILNSAEFAKTEAYLKLNDYDVVYSGCTITATVNRFTDELTNVYYYKAANVTADMTGNGTLSSYGDVSVMFKLEDKANFDITWENGYPTSPLDTEIAQ